MKKLATLLLAAGLVFCSVTGASAIDFKAKGQWIMNFEYGAGDSGYTDLNGGGNSQVGAFGGDNFNAEQRVRLQLEAVASESLSGTVYFEIGESTWGQNKGGAALGADQTVIEVKQAYLDWVVPNTDLKVRMGIQGIGLPSYTTGGSMVFNNDVAGIVLSNKFNDNVAMTLFWARPYNDNYDASVDNRGSWDNYLDNIDAFGLALPLTFDGFAMVPWVTYMSVGQNAYRGGMAGGSANAVLTGLLPFNGLQGSFLSSLNRSDLYANANVWHVGLTGEVTMADPFRLAWDVNYGSADFGTVDSLALGGKFGTKDFEVKRSGWYASLLAEYKMDWGTPGLYAWYSSGDDDDPFNGSERMPTISNGNADNQFSNFASSGNPYISRENVLSSTLIGTWGIGLRVKDFSFVEDLKHTFRVNYFGGTNHTDMAQALILTSGAPFNTHQPNAAFESGQGMYLTTADSAWEFGLSSDYQIYDNLKLYVEMAYLVLDFDQDNSVWGDRFTATDAYNISASFVYSF